MKTNNLRLHDLFLALALAAACSFFAPGALCQQKQSPGGDADVQTTSAPARITQAVDESNLVLLKGNVHPLARAEFDQGAVSDGQPLHRMLLLLQRSADQEAALQKLLDDQQNKSSANYHAWLTPTQFGQQFGPADADIQTVTNWLQSHGFQINTVSAGRTVIEFSGNAGQVRNAFHTEMHMYLVNGEAHTANARDPQIPSALAPVVTGLVSLNNFPRKSYARILGQFRHTAGKPGLEPLFTFPNPFNGTTFYGLAPGDFATIYNSKPLLAAGNDGTGQTIAVVGETNINVQDVQQFRKMFGLSANFDATNVILNGEDPGITSKGEEAEADLDVEWSGAAAPGATVKFVVSASTPASAGIDLSALYIVEQNLAGAMSESYGQCEAGLGTAGNAFYSQLWEQAAAQGITVILSAGDGGSAGCDDFGTEQVATLGLAVSGLASTPFNVSVGGTDFDDVNTWGTYWNATNDPTGSSAKSYIPEIPWNQNCAQIGLSGCGPTAPNGSVNIVAGSGGPSNIYPKPKWQMGVVGMPNDNHRDQPDISLFASAGFDGTGYVYCQSDQTVSGAAQCDLNNASAGILDFGVVGGTSASAPAFAGIMALVNQYQAAHGGTNRQGNANYVLYALANKAGASCTSSTAETTGCVFNDVTKGNSILPTGTPGVGTNSVPCKGGSPDCSASIVGSTGVLVDPSHPTTEAWTATAGYDMTTGLGTVNVNSLATSWVNVSRIPTTSTLTLSPTTGITHGADENVAVAINVKANAGTGAPSGDVSLIATPIPANGPTQGLDHFTLTNGAVSGAKTQSLPGGTYNVSAHYAGDGTNAPSDSGPVQVTVGQESSKTFIVVPTFNSNGGNVTNGNASSFVYGTPYIIRMYVTDQNGVANPSGPPSPTCLSESPLSCPTGKVSLTANGSPVDGGSFALNTGGYTRDIAPTLGGGTFSLSAQYSGDNSYQGSTSAADTLTITPAPTSQQWFNDPSFAVVNQPFPLGTAIGTGVAGVSPTGTVTFLDGSNALPGTVTQMAQGQGFNVVLYASTTTSISTGGSHTITATYSGDANYGPSTSSPITFVVKYPTSLSQTESAKSINYGQSITVTAVVTGNSKGSSLTGRVGFFGSSTAITGPVTTAVGTDASGNPTLTATVSTTPQFSEVISVSYSGDPNYTDVSTSGDFVTVNIPDFTLPSPLTINATAGQPATVTFNVTPTSNTPSQVTLGVLGLSVSGATVNISPSSVSLNGSAVPVTLTLNTTGPSGNAAGATAAQVRRTETPSTPYFSPNGTTWFLTSLGAIFAFALLFARDKRRKLAAALLATAFCLEAFVLGCGGGGVGGGGGGGGGGAVPSSITISAATSKGPNIAPITITVTVTSSKTVTGTVNIFAAAGPESGPLTLVNGQVTWAVPPAFGVGTVGCTAQYSGDANNLPSQTPAPFNIVFTGTTQFEIQGNTGGLTHGSSVIVNLQ